MQLHASKSIHMTVTISNDFHLFVMYRTSLEAAFTLDLCTVIVAVVLLSSQLTSAGASTEKTIYFLAAGPLPDDPPFKPSWAGGTAGLHAVQLARQHINNRSDILPGYHLEIIEADSGCNILSKYLIAFAEQYIENFKDKTIAGIIGPGCSDTTRLLAPVIARDEVSLIQIAPSATSPELVDNAYTTTFRIPSSALIYADESTKLILRNSWRRVAVVYDGTRDIFQITFLKFMEKLKDHEEITVSYRAALYDKFYPIEDIQRQQTRLAFVFGSGGTAGKLMCLAYHLGMTYPTTQWIFHDRGIGNFNKNITVTHNGITYDCSDKDMREAINGIILNNYIFKPINPDGKSLPVNVSYSEYYEQYNAGLDGKTGEDLVGFKWASNFYDATWALALAINKSLPELRERNLKLEDYTIGRSEITKIVVNKLLDQSEINFRGVSESRVRFESTRDTLTVLRITAVHCNTSSCRDEEVGIFNESILQLNSAAQNVFINDSFQETSVTVPLALGSITLIATLVVLVITILLQITNIVYYNFKPIKATSPNLSHLIFSGCYLLLISIFFFAMKDIFQFNSLAYGMLCNLYTLCVSLGFSLVFGTICAKIWRVYRIFRHFRSARSIGAISDNALILFVIFLLFIDMILGTTWILFDPWLHKSTGEFIGTEIVVVSTCSCNHLLEWILAIGAYKGLLILILLLLAILNRNIQKKEFKHTKKVSMFIYTEILLAGITLPLFQLLTNIDFTASSIVMTTFLLATVCGCLGFVFLPPIIPLIKIKYRRQPLNIHMARRSTVSLFTLS